VRNSLERGLGRNSQERGNQRVLSGYSRGSKGAGGSGKSAGPSIRSGKS